VQINNIIMLLLQQIIQLIWMDFLTYYPFAHTFITPYHAKLSASLDIRDRFFSQILAFCSIILFLFSSTGLSFTD